MEHIYSTTKKVAVSVPSRSVFTEKDTHSTENVGKKHFGTEPRLHPACIQRADNCLQACNTVNSAFSSVYKVTRSNINHCAPWRERQFAAELTRSLTESESNGSAPGSRKWRRTLSLAHGDNRAAELELIHDMQGLIQDFEVGGG